MISRISSVTTSPVSTVVICAALNFCAFSAPSAAGAITRASAMADAYSAIGAGCEASLLNPSLTGAHGGAAFIFPSLSANLANSSLSIGFYNELNGAFWDDDMKDSILDGIPDDGLRVDACAEVIPFAFKILDRYAGYMRVAGDGSLRVSKDLADLALYGNEPGRDYLITEENTGGENMVYMEIGASASFGSGWSPPGCSELAWGLAAGFVHGFAYGDVPVSDGRIFTDGDTGEIIGDGEFEARWSFGGNGFTTRCGVSTVYDGDWQLGFSVENLPGFIRWTNRNEFASVSVHDTLSGISGGGDEEEFEVIEDSGDLDAFNTRLPIAACLGGAREFGSWLVATDLWLREGDGLRFAAGTEYAVPWERLLLRVGIGFGGVEAFTLAGGFGFHFGSFAIDFSVANYHGLFNGSRGLALGLGFGYR